MSEVLIDITNLSVANDSTSIVKDWGFSIRKSDLILIVGNNGTGKSTLLLTICGLLKPSKGKITMKNQCSIAYMPQQFVVPSHLPMTVLSYLKASDSIFDVELLKKLHIFHLMNRKLNVLSGGELRKVLFYSVVTQDCDVVMMDEPENSLDQDSVAVIISEIISQTKNKAFVIISHEKEKLIESSTHILDINSTIHCIKHPICTHENSIS